MRPNGLQRVFSILEAGPAVKAVNGAVGRIVLAPLTPKVWVRKISLEIKLLARTGLAGLALPPKNCHGACWVSYLQQFYNMPCPRLYIVQVQNQLQILLFQP